MQADIKEQTHGLILHHCYYSHPDLIHLLNILNFVLALGTAKSSRETLFLPLPNPIAIGNKIKCL